MEGLNLKHINIFSKNLENLFLGKKVHFILRKLTTSDMKGD